MTCWQLLAVLLFVHVAIALTAALMRSGPTRAELDMQAEIAASRETLHTERRLVYALAEHTVRQGTDPAVTRRVARRMYDELAQAHIVRLREIRQRYSR